MKIVFTKHSDEEHTVRIERTDSSTESKRLVTREFLLHDLAHLALELEVPVPLGYWGSVAAGAALDGRGIRGRDIADAESISGAVQGLMRDECSPDKFVEVLRRIRPELVTEDIAVRIHARCRQLRGHWRATPYGEDMVLAWDEEVSGNGCAAT